MAADFWTSNHWRCLTTKARLKDAHQGDFACGLTERNIADMKSCIVAYMVDVAKHSQQLIRQRTVGTAVTFMRRFYISRDMREHNPCIIATACLYFACKVEETHVQAKFFHGPLNNKFPERWRGWPPSDPNSLFVAELTVLAELQNNLVVFSPYNSLQIYLEVHPDLIPLANTTWGTINDSYHTDMCLIYPPFIIASASILIAAQKLGREQDVSSFIAKTDLDMLQVANACRDIVSQYGAPLISSEEFKRLTMLLEQ